LGYAGWVKRFTCHRKEILSLIGEISPPPTMRSRQKNEFIARDDAKFVYFSIIVNFYALAHLFF